MSVGYADLAFVALSLCLIATAVYAVLYLRFSGGFALPDADDGLCDGAVLIADGGRITRLASEARHLLGDVLGQSLTAALDGFLGGPNSDGSEAVRRLQRTGEPVRLLTRDGGGRPVELSGTPEGGQLRIVLRDASLIEDRLAQAEAELARREEALRESTLRQDVLASLIENAPVIAWSRDPDGTAHWSGGAIPAGTSTITAAQVVPFLGEGRRDAPCRPAGEPVKCRVEVGVSGGETAALHVTEIAGPDDSVVGFAVDASTARSAEQTLTRFVQTMTETFAHLTVGLAIFDRNGTLALFNPALVQMWQADASWLARRPSLREVIEALRSSRRIPEAADFHAWRAQLLKLFDDPEQADYEEVWHLPDGSSIRVLARPHPHGSLAFVFDDVTERMQLERRFRHSIDLRRATLDRLDEGLAVFGPDGMLQFVNDAFHNIWSTDTATLGPAAHAREVLSLCSSASVETDVWDRMLSFIVADAHRRPWATRLTLGSGRIVKARIAALPDGASMVLFADITDSERIAGALRERNEALEAAEEMRTAMLDQISHRLRTPLNTIFGFAQLITNPRFGSLNERQTEYANGIIEAAGQLLDTIDDVSDLATLQLDPLHHEGAEYMVWETLDLTRQLLEKRAACNGATLAVAEPADGSEHLSSEMSSLRQIVFNMATEAVQRSAEGGTITLDARALPGSTLEIATIETGGTGPAEDSRSESKTESLLQRMAARAGGTYRLTAEPDGTVRAVCRFPGALTPHLAALPAPGNDSGDTG